MTALVTFFPKYHPFWETWVRSLSWKYHLEEGVSTYSSILAWRIPWTQELEGYSPQGHKESDMTERLSTAHHPSRLRESQIHF